MIRTHNKHLAVIRCVVMSVMVTVALSAAGSVRSINAQDLRTWTDSTGRHRIEAKWIALAGAKVVLERADGGRLQIDLKLLSQPDQQYVAEQLADSTPFEPVDESPFQPVRSPAADEPASPETLSSDWSQVRMADLTAVQDSWDVQMVTAAVETMAQPRPIAIPAKNDFFEKMRGFVVNPQCGRAVIGYARAPRKHGRETAAAQTRLVLCDLEAGQATEVAQIDGQFAPLDLDDNGSRLLVRRDEWGFGNQDQLELWHLTSGSVSRVMRWRPYDRQSGPGRDVKWARFLDTQRIATVGGRGQLVVWEMPSAKAIYSLKIQSDCVPALSSDRRWIAVYADERIGLFDVSSGRVLVSQPAPKMTAPQFAFRPGGSELCALSRERIMAWDCTNGQLLSEILLTDVHATGKPLWSDDRHVLVQGKHLFDLDLQVKIWEYSGGPAQYAAGFCWFVVHPPGSKTSAVVPSVIPHAGVEQTLQQVAADPDFFVLRPGVTVEVDVSGLPDAAKRQEVHSQLVEKLEALGFQVTERGSIRLVATVEEKPQKRKVRYRHSGTYKVRHFITTLQFVYEGQVAWQRSTSNIQPMVMLARDDNLADYLKRNEKPSYRFLKTVRLPERLIKPTGKPGLGKSAITVAGVQ